MNPANTDTEDAAIDVCIIEDHLDYRKTLMAELQDSAGLTCSRGFSAVETAIESIDRGYVPDVVLLDIGLPKMDGITAIPELRKRCPDASILVLTVSDDRVVLFRALGAGAGGYLLKTASIAEIRSGILEIRRGAAPLSPAMAQMALSAFNRFAPREHEARLTSREKEILTLLADGLIKKEIADRLDVSYHTVDNHTRNIYEKLQVRSLAAAITRATKEGLL
jgi:DNA-binding NarL/FixJ family response regulator